MSARIGTHTMTNDTRRHIKALNRELRLDDGLIPGMEPPFWTGVLAASALGLLLGAGLFWLLVAEGVLTK